MPEIEDSILARASRTWHEACRKLDVRVVAPFILREGNSSILCLAFLPDFGGPNGMVIGAMDLPNLKPDARLKLVAKEKGLFLSFVNAPTYAKDLIEDKVFKEALEDWGYYGMATSRPMWFAGYDHSRD